MYRVARQREPNPFAVGESQAIVDGRRERDSDHVVDALGGYIDEVVVALEHHASNPSLENVRSFPYTVFDDGDVLRADTELDRFADLALVIGDLEFVVAPVEDGAAVRPADPYPKQVGAPGKGRDEGRRGVGEHFARRVELLDRTVGHHGEPIADRRGLVLVVSDVEHRNRKRREVGAELVPESALDRRVEVGERFVEQQRVGSGRERACERDPLALATRL